MSSIKQIMLPNLVTYDIDGKKVTLTTTDPGAGSSLAQGKMIAVVGDEPPAPTPSYIPPSWAEGTDAEILVALEKHYNDEIDLTEYWSIGDERTFQIQAIPNNSSTTNLEAQPAQSITMVLSNVGGYELVTSINGHTECVFRVDQKDCLATAGRMNNTNTTYSPGYNLTPRRTWLNDEYYNAIPVPIRLIFKLFKYYYKSNPNSSPQIFNNGDYFVLSSELETTNTLSGNSSYANEGKQIEYYKTSANLIKKVGNSSSNWWTRTVTDFSSNGTNKEFYFSVTDSGNRGYENAYSSEYGIAPFGVI